MAPVDFDEVKDNLKSWFRQYTFPVGLILFQCVFIVLYGVHADYGLRLDENVTLAASYNDPPVQGDVEFYYAMFQDVHVMMFIGFGFLMTFLRRYSFSSVSFNFFSCCFCLRMGSINSWLCI